MPAIEIDAEKLAILRRWATGLQADARQEVSAAGKAIILLIDEVERLHVRLWGRRLYPDSQLDVASEEPDAGIRAQPTPYDALRDRLSGQTEAISPQPEGFPDEGFHS